MKSIDFSDNYMLYKTKRQRFGADAVSNQNVICKEIAVMTDPILTKVCSKCQETKSVSEFHKNKKNKDGLKRHCKECRAKEHVDRLPKVIKRRKIYYEQNRLVICEKSRKYNDCNKELIKERKRKYRENNKAKIVKHKKEYYENNRDKIRKKRKLWREEHKEYINELQKKYRKNNRESVYKWQKEYHKIWRKENPDKIKELSIKNGHKYRALKRNVTIEDFNPKEVFKRDNYICQLCGCKTRPDFKNHHHPKYPNLDHIIPLSKGGEHSRKNTQCLCRQCNIVKSNSGTGDQLRLFG